MAARRRAAAGKRWSANAPVTLYDRDRQPLPADTDIAPDRAQVRWRLDGRQRKRTLLANELGELSGFLAHLRAAYEHNWDADDKGWPIPPRQLPVSTSPDVVGYVEAEVTEDEVPAQTAPRSLLSLTEGPTRRVDFVSLVERYLGHLATTRSRKTSMPRQAGTLNGYRLELGFAEDFLRYAPGDPRLPIEGTNVGDPPTAHRPRAGTQRT